MKNTFSESAFLSSVVFPGEINVEMKKMNKCGKENKNISCDAKNCVYHTTDCGCTAEAIKVSNKDACKCSETCCATFQMKKTDNTVI